MLVCEQLWLHCTRQGGRCGWMSMCTVRLSLWASGDWQLHHTILLLTYHLSHRVFGWNVISPKWLRPLQPRYDTLWLQVFPKTKITFGREFQTIYEIQENTTGQLLRIRTPRCLLWRELKHHCSMYNVSYVMRLETFWTDLVTYVHIEMQYRRNTFAWCQH